MGFIYPRRISQTRRAFCQHANTVGRPTLRTGTNSRLFALVGGSLIYSALWLLMGAHRRAYNLRDVWVTRIFVYLSSYLLRDGDCPACSEQPLFRLVPTTVAVSEGFYLVGLPAGYWLQATIFARPTFHGRTRGYCASLYCLCRR